MSFSDFKSVQKVAEQQGFCKFLNLTIKLQKIIL